MSQILDKKRFRHDERKTMEDNRLRPTMNWGVWTISMRGDLSFPYKITGIGSAAGQFIHYTILSQGNPRER